jgi:hypothetical protein
MNSYFKKRIVLCPACNVNEFWQDFAWKTYCLTCYISIKSCKPQEAPLKALQIDLVMLRRLIQLTHPDRHSGSDSAHIATRYLLELKKLTTESSHDPH